MMQVHEGLHSVLFTRPPDSHLPWAFQEIGRCGTGRYYNRLCEDCRAGRLARCVGLSRASQVQQQQGRQMRTLVHAESSPARWNLDDVERISRGLPSKAKLGSRAVPHRLNAEERKEFELAKKRGYVIQKARARRYPLVNTYQNYCDALGVPCIRIEQGSGFSLDQVVIDLSPLHLSKVDHVGLQKKLSTSIEAALAQDQRIQCPDDAAAENPVVQKMQEGSSIELSVADMDLVDSTLADNLNDGTSPLRYEASRSMAKVLCQVAADVWKSVSNLPESTEKI